MNEAASRNAARRRRARARSVALAVAILVLGAAVAAVYALRVAGWDRVAGLDGPAYAVPGSPGSTVDARIVPLLLALGGGALGLAVALVLTAFILSRGIAAGRAATGEGNVPLRTGPARRRVRFAVIGPVLLLVVLGTFGVRWYAYVTNTGSPFDEVGIGLNARVPEPLRAWGCGRLKATFGGSTPPPLGSGARGDPGRWR